MSYELPVATATILGGVKIGEGLAITEDGVLYLGSIPEEPEEPTNEYAICDEGVTSVGNATTVWTKSQADIPESVQTIGDKWFREATSLATITGAEGLTSVGSAFCSGATVLTALSLPTLTSAGSSFCSDATALTNLSLPALTEAGLAFCKGATVLTNLSLPALTSTGTYFCSGATALTTLSLPALTEANSNFCYNATALTNLSFGGRNNVLTISATTSGYISTFNWPNITVDSLVKLGTALVNGTGAIIFNATAWGRLSSTQQAIFTNKGYTVSTVA